MEKIIEIDTCYQSCPFYEVNMDGMACAHPHWEQNPDPYSNMIITQDNSRGGKIPPLCPLRQEDLVIKYKLGT